MFLRDSADLRMVNNNHSCPAVAPPAQVTFYIVFLVTISKEETSRGH